MKSGGTLSGSGTLTVAGAATLTASVSAESGTGTTLVEGGASITANNSLSMTLSRTLEFQGTSTVTGANGGLIALGTTGILKIDSGATFNDESGTSGGGVTGLTINGSTYTGPLIGIVNAGTWEKTVGAGTTISSAPPSAARERPAISPRWMSAAGILDLAGGGADVFTSYVGGGTIDFWRRHADAGCEFQHLDFQRSVQWRLDHGERQLQCRNQHECGRRLW